MGTAERRERERIELRHRILDAARKLFVEHGYESVSMRMVAREIEYSPTAIYFHFKDKEALFQELCALDFLALAGTVRGIEQVEDPVERLRRIGMLYVEFGRDYPNHYRLMFMTPTPPMRVDEAALVTRDPEEHAYDLLRRTVADAVARGRFRPGLEDEEQLAQLLWAGVHGVVSLQIAKRGNPWVEMRDLDRSAELMIDVLIRGLTAPGAGEDPVP